MKSRTAICHRHEAVPAARPEGYDAIVLLSPIGYNQFVAEGRIPLSIELNLVVRDWK